MNRNISLYREFVNRNAAHVPRSQIRISCRHSGRERFASEPGIHNPLAVAMAYYVYLLASKKHARSISASRTTSCGVSTSIVPRQSRDSPSVTASTSWCGSKSTTMRQMPSHARRNEEMASRLEDQSDRRGRSRVDRSLSRDRKLRLPDALLQ